jgi:hypothetical protein
MERVISRSQWDVFLFEGCSPASLGLFRIIFGLGLVVHQSSIDGLYF